ncbi:MAG: hypothetical protein ACI9GW_001537 [Halieaceae bacterium]|jgi:hypothetical protein
MRISMISGAGAVFLTALLFCTATAANAAEGASLRALVGEKEMPPQVIAEQEALERADKIGQPPGKAKAKDLLKKIHARPGGRERIEHAEKARRPGGGKKVSTNSQTPNVVDGILSFIVTQAQAADAGSLDLTPTVDQYGAHRSLYSPSPYGYATFYGALVNHAYPRDAYVRLSTSIVTGLGGTATTPHVQVTVRVPADGWYTLNMNAYLTATSGVSIKHYEGGKYVTLENLQKTSGWSDYATLQYLSAGYHLFYWVLPQGGYVSRISMDPYKPNSFVLLSGG